MSDAPERIWAKTYVDETKAGYWEGAPILPNNPENQGVEYLRADLHAARIEELERERDMERDRLAGLLKEAVKAGNHLSVYAQTTGGTAGRDEGLVAAIERWAATLASVQGEVAEPKHIRDMTSREVGEHLFPHRKRKAAPEFPPAHCTAWEDCWHDGVCHDADCGAIGPNDAREEGEG